MTDAPRHRTGRQRAASRINGAKGRGPSSPQGKARSALNSMVHGLLGRSLSADEAERAVGDALREKLAARYDVNDPQQAALVDRTILATLRLNRTRTLITEHVEHLASVEYSAFTQRHALTVIYMAQADKLLRQQYGSSPGKAVLKALAEKVGLRIDPAHLKRSALMRLTNYAQRFRSERDSSLKKLEKLRLKASCA